MWVASRMGQQNALARRLNVVRWEVFEVHSLVELNLVLRVSWRVKAAGDGQVSFLSRTSEQPSLRVLRIFNSENGFAYHQSFGRLNGLVANLVGN